MSAVIACVALPSAAAALPPDFEARPLITGLTGATGVTFAPDGRAFVIEKAGKLKVVQPGAKTATQILDISGHVNEYGDRGLLGLALDADFADNGFLYLLYTYDVNPLTPDSDAPMVSRLVRVTIGPGSTVTTPETVLIGSYTAGPCPPAANTLDCIPSNGTSHSIGSVRTAPDGTLYVGSGDSSDFNSVDELAFRTYDEQSYAGKILHVDRNGKGLPGHSFCPTDTTLDHVCTKLYAKGFRNPFRFQIRPTGGLSVGDVGWNTWEEVDLIGAAGSNYGWPCYEAHTHTPGYKDDPRCAALYAKEGTPDAVKLPDYDYDRSTGGSAVIGGPVYTGTEYPDGYRNSIFIGDYTGNFLKRLTVDGKGQVTAETFQTSWIGTDLELGPTGNLVSVNFGTGAPGDGFVEEFVYTPGNHSPVAHMSATPTFGNAPLNVKFSASDGGGPSTDPDGDTLGYSWDFGDGATGTGATAQHTYTMPGSYTATLTVSDGRGLSATKSIQISPGGDPPSVSIDAPTAGGHYRDGDVVQLRGSATDPHDGALHGASLQWLVRLHHATHIHPLTGLSGEATSFTAVRDHDADSHYELTLTATDSDGLTASKSIEIYPETIPLSLESVPTGAPVSYGGRAFLAPTSLSTAIGYDTTVSAAQRFSADGRRFQFERWSDGGTLVHSLRVPDYQCTLRATYLEDFAAVGTASASGVEAPDFAADKALDDRSLTRWSSTVTDAPWWQVDLGAARDVARVEVDWEAAYAAGYTILTSPDGVSFAAAANDTATGPGTKVTSFPARSARYVRVQATAKANPSWGISAYDIRVLGAVAGAGAAPACAPEVGPPPPDAPLPPAGPPAQPPADGGTKPHKDVTRPELHAAAISKQRNGKRVLSVHVSERATLKVGLAKPVRGHWRSLKTLTRTFGAGTARIALPQSLKPGRYRVTVSATDRAGNKVKKPLTLGFRVGA